MDISQKKRKHNVGVAPGTVVYTGRQRAEKVKIDIIDYNKSRLQAKAAKKVEDCFKFKDRKTVTWINVIGVHEPEIIQKIGAKFGLHPLVMEDIAHVGRRPKIEDMGSYFFVVLKMLSYNKAAESIDEEHVSLIIGRDFVLSFQEREGDVFDPLRERIRAKKGKVRDMGSDYLAYSIMDAIVDNYFIILENIGENIDSIEQMVIEKTGHESLRLIHKTKQELIQMRQSVWPLREIINRLQRGESRIIKKTTEIYLRDLYDHTIQIIDSIETFRDLAAGMLDVYLSSASNKMNEIMKFLTIFTTIFIPLTFITGIYGMNFRYMPELEWKHSYFFVWGFILAVAGFMLFFFRKRKWI